MSYNCKHCKDLGKLPMFMPGSMVPCDWCQGPQATAEPVAEAEEDDAGSTFTVNGELIEIGRVVQFANGGVEVHEGAQSWVLFPDADTAGTAARAYWADMLANDPEEFRQMVGTECLTAWALGQSAGPGSTQVTSVEAWLDLHLDVPEELLAGYDGEECEIEAVTAEAIEEIGFTPGVAYRSN